MVFIRKVGQQGDLQLDETASITHETQETTDVRVQPLISTRQKTLETPSVSDLQGITNQRRGEQTCSDEGK